MRTLAVTALALTWLAGCGDDDATPGDGSVTADSAVGGVAIPWLAENVPPITAPTLTPCPDGWREVPAPVDPEDGVAAPTTCDPYPEGGPVDCAGVDEAHFPGEPACRRIGPECPADGLPADLPADRPVVYVLQGAAAGGDGTRASPYPSPTSFSLGGRPRGTIVALGAGFYEATLRLPAGVGLWGACVAETVLTTASPELRQGVLAAVGADVEIRALRIADAARPGVSVNAAGDSATLESVVVDGVEIAGLLMLGGALDGREIVVRGTRVRSGLGHGVHVEDASLSLRRAVVERAVGVGILSGGAGGIVLLEDAAIRDTEGAAGLPEQGRALIAALGGRAEASRVLIERAHEFGAASAQPGSSISLSDVIIRDTRTTASGLLGLGIAATEGASARGSRVLVAESRTIGVFLSDDGTDLELSDSWIRETMGAAGGTTGRGLNVQRGASALVSRVRIEDSRQAGITGIEGSMRLEDVSVHDTLGESAPIAQQGRGVHLQVGSTAEMVRVLVERSREFGLFFAEVGAVTLEDVVSRDTMGREVDGWFGRGMSVQDGGDLRGSRILVDRNRDVGIMAIDGDASIDFESVVVRDTAARECAAAGCVDDPAGMGVGSYGAASVSLRDFAVTGSTLCGVHVADGAGMDLSSGEVSGSEIGACVQVDGYEIERLGADVEYRGNAVNLQATSLPVPEPAGTLPDP